MSPHHPRKRFGQHFLADAEVLERIRDAIDPRIGDHLVEIGPGLGALTRWLIDHDGPLDLIEIDRDLIGQLQPLLSDRPGVSLHEADALRFDWSNLAARGLPLRVVGNLPYNISTPLLFRLLRFHHLIADMHFLLQREVVERMAAEPGSKDYGRLSVMLQYQCQVEPLFVVPPQAFSPPPKVDSQVVRAIPKSTERRANVDPKRLEAVVRSAFSQRRKTIRNTLSSWASASQLAALGLDSGLRPQDLSVDDFVAITNINDPAPPHDHPPRRPVPTPQADG